MSRISDLLTHGSKTKRVIEIVEEMCEELGRLPKYQEVAERYAREGGNENTARTQYAHWKRVKRAEATREVDGEFEISEDEAQLVPSGSTDSIPLVIDPQGGLTIPRPLLAAMEIDPDGRVTARIDDGELRIIAPRVAIRRAQAIVR